MRLLTMEFTVDQRRMSLDLVWFLTAFFVVWILRVASYDLVDKSIVSPTARAAYSNSLKVMLWVVPAWVFVHRVKRFSPAKYLGCSVFPSLRDWSFCLVTSGLFLAAVSWFEVAIGKKAFSGAAILSGAAPTVIQLIISPLAEEILFRGLVMKDLMLLLRPPLAVLLTSLLFLGAHLPYWLTHGGLTQATLANALGVFLFSVLACVLYARTGSVWPSTLAHIANNVLASALVASQG